MDDWKLPWDGGCRCGKVRLRITKQPLLAMACHCTGCQSMSASAFSMSLAIPTEGFAVTQGEPVLGGLSKDVHYFCPDCMTWMFTRPQDMDWFVNIRPSMLDDHRWFVPYVETFASERLPWAVTPARHSFDGIPGMAEFPPLIEAYGREGARP